MSQEFFSRQEYAANERPRRLKRMIDHIVSLAPQSEEPSVVTEVATVIERMKSMQAAPVEQFSALETVTTLSIQNPEVREFQPLLDDTAEFVLNELEKYTPDEHNKMLSLHSVWSAISAWDLARSEATANLCVAVLNNYRGAGQPQLVEAYKLARDSSSCDTKLPFNEALDIVNSQMEMEAA